MKHKKIVFVCTGNTCRSPMAEAVMRAELKQRRIRWYTVVSAGLHARAGDPMAENARKALLEEGIACPENFRARSLTPKLLREAYAVICMTREQAASLTGDNVKSMAVFAGRDVPGPYGQSQQVYRDTLRLIRDCVPKIIAILDIGNENQ